MERKMNEFAATRIYKLCVVLRRHYQTRAAEGAVVFTIIYSEGSLMASKSGKCSPSFKTPAIFT